MAVISADIDPANTRSPWNKITPDFATHDNILSDTLPKNMTFPTELIPAVEDDTDRLLPNQPSLPTLGTTPLGNNERDAFCCEHVTFIQTFHLEIFKKITLPNDNNSPNDTGCSTHSNGPTVQQNPPQLDHAPIPNQKSPTISCPPKLTHSSTRPHHNWTDIGDVSHAETTNDHTLSHAPLRTLASCLNPINRQYKGFIHCLKNFVCYSANFCAWPHCMPLLPTLPVTVKTT